ncbi:MAG: hypothetical protein ACI91B_000786 [Planctomycetota bacterium]|jgi:hypothetical protein
MLETGDAMEWHTPLFVRGPAQEGPPLNLPVILRLRGRRFVVIAAAAAHQRCANAGQSGAE